MKRRLYFGWLLFCLGSFCSLISVSAAAVRFSGQLGRGESQFVACAGYLWFRCEDAATAAHFSLHNYYLVLRRDYQSPIVPSDGSAVEADVDHRP